MKSTSIVDATKKGVCKQCVAEHGVEVTMIVKTFSALEERRWENTWRPEERTVQIAENIEGCKWTIEDYVYK